LIDSILPQNQQEFRLHSIRVLIFPGTEEFPRFDLVLIDFLKYKSAFREVLRQYAPQFNDYAINPWIADENAGGCARSQLIHRIFKGVDCVTEIGVESFL
jgi:hypothetical protein